MAPDNGATTPHSRREKRELHVQTGPTLLQTRFAASGGTNQNPSHQDADGSHGPTSADSVNHGTAWSWRNELRGPPSMVVQDVDGTSRMIHDGEVGGAITRPITGPRSEAGESEGASSVFSVTDFGFGAASRLYEPAKSHLDLELPDRIMDAQELQLYLGLTPLVPNRNVANSIYKKFEESLCVSDANQEYLPINKLYDILSIGVIASLMRELYPQATLEHLREKVAEITGGQREGWSRRRVFAILIFTKRLESLEAFIRHGIWDDDLPLERCSLTGPTRSHCATRTDPNRIDTTLFDDWERSDVDLFYVYQPMFHVPFFDLGKNRLCSYEFGSEVRLPWRSCEEIAGGGSGIVYRIEIHPNHHNYESSQPGPLHFALKKINSQESEKYKKELAAHEKAHAKLQKGKHLIKLLLTFQHGKDHYLMFECADGCLEDFWENRTAKEPHRADRWAAEQCFGVASALKQIHGMATWQKDQQRRQSLSPEQSSDRDGGDRSSAHWGRHGDIKPKNILWFSKYDNCHKDHLVVSDLGLTRYHSLLSRSQVKPADIEGFSEAYRPPEMNLDNQPITRKADIWSLGCVFLELCTWYLQGIDGVNKFLNKRLEDDTSDREINNFEDDKFFNLVIDDSRGHKSAIVKLAVDTWIQELTDLATEKRSIFAQHMLQIIKKKMLIVKVADRQSIDIICAEIKRILDRIPHQPEVEPGSPTVPNRKEEGPSEHKTEEVGSMVQFATGNTDSPGIESQMSFAMQQRLALARHTREAENAAAAGLESPSSDSEPAPDGLQGDYYDDVEPTQPESQPYNDALLESDCLSLQTPITNMGDSFDLTAATAGTRRSQEVMKAELDKIDAIIQQRTNLDLGNNLEPDENNGRGSHGTEKEPEPAETDQAGSSTPNSHHTPRLTTPVPPPDAGQSTAQPVTSLEEPSVPSTTPRPQPQPQPQRGQSAPSSVYPDVQPRPAVTAARSIIGSDITEQENNGSTSSGVVTRVESGSKVRRLGRRIKRSFKEGVEKVVTAGKRTSRSVNGS